MLVSSLLHLSKEKSRMENEITEYPNLDTLVENCDYATKLAVTAWVFKNIVKHAEQGGSFRYLIYHRLGFDIDAYITLHDAGGMEISNEFDLNKIPEIVKIVQLHKIDPLKEILGLCDEPNCFSSATCGFPIENMYRKTCLKHSLFDKT